MSDGKILVVEDDQDLREALVDILSLNDFSIEAVDNGETALQVLDDSIQLVFSDIRMDGMDGVALLKRIRAMKPYMPVILMTAYGTIDQAVAAMKMGAVDYVAKPFDAQTLVEKARKYLYVDASSEDDFIAVSEPMKKLKQMAARVAQSKASVMIHGESGTGKEVLARYIHRHSDRAEKPFIAINCAAIPENMLEAILFGYEKGAFTGAVKSTPGKFELAHGGSIFLDEIGEMDVALQAKLLRVLQEKEVERIGSHKTFSLDVRVISASNVDMEKAIAEGKFREDLYYRLNVFPMTLPPLRERPEDIPALAEFLLKRHQIDSVHRAQLTPQAIKKLQAHSWRGNIRELDNVIQRAVVLSAGGDIDEDLILLD